MEVKVEVHSRQGLTKPLKVVGGVPVGSSPVATLKSRGACRVGIANIKRRCSIFSAKLDILRVTRRFK